MKEEYLKTLEKPKMVIVVDDKIESTENMTTNLSELHNQVKETFEDPGLD